MENILLPLFSLGEIFADFNFILKIFVIMTIYSWVKNHIQNTALAMIVFFSITFFVVFEMWVLFGGIYLFWMLLMFGVSQILIDFFFITPGGGQKQESPVSSGGDIAARQRQLAGKQRNFASGFLRKGG